MKRHLQCAELANKVILEPHQILRLARNLKVQHFSGNPWISSANRKTIRRHSDDNPTIIRPWNRHLAPAASETLLVPPWRRILYGKIQHLALRLSPKIARNAAPATKSHTPTSPNTAPATQNGSLGIYSLGIYSLLASILSWHLFSLGIYSLLASILSWQKIE